MRILHLSDIHLGELLDFQKKNSTQISGTVFIGNDNKPNPTWLAKLLLKRDELLEDKQPDIIVVSGDIGWSGAAEDYEYSLKFLNELKQNWSDTTFVLTPGNHDVNWELSKKKQNPQLPFIEFLHKFYKDDFEKIFVKTHSESIKIENRKFIASVQTVEKNDIDTPIIIVSVNSSFELQHDDPSDSENHLKVPRIPIEPLFLIEEKINKVIAPSIKIFVLHHHLFPFIDNHWSDTYQPEALAQTVDTTMIANSAQIQNWLAANKFHLVLHGHKHISHSRIDSLSSGAQSTRRHIIVNGAGSPSVCSHEIPHGEKHSFSIIDITPGSLLSWNIKIENREISRSPLEKTRRGYIFQEEVGAQPAQKIASFSGDNWHKVHAAIFNTCCPSGIPFNNDDSNVLTNFISTVSNVEQFKLVRRINGSSNNNYEWCPPKTARRGKDAITTIDLEDTFRALHPEYAPSHEWKQHDELLQILKEQHHRFHFRHGARFFEVEPGQGISSSQLWIAANSVLTKSTQAYATTFRPQLDIKGEDSEPMPSLIGIQFIENNDKLNLIATFRNIELSYWWVVNFLELSRVLFWAIEDVLNDSLKPGYITMMSPIAQWNFDPKAPNIDRLDEKELNEIAIFAQRLFTEEEVRNKVSDYLEEKKKNINIYSLEDRGLLRFSELLNLRINEPCCQHKKEELKLLTKLAQSIQSAAQNIRKAIREKTNRKHSIVEAIKDIDTAIRDIKSITRQ